MNIKKIYPYILISLSAVGLFASAILTNDAILLAKNPEADLPCNINPFLSCTSVATVWQSSVFGFPNSILGTIAFSLLFGVGLALLFHVIPSESMSEKIFGLNKRKKFFWTLVNLGTFASVLFVLWFAYQSIFVIRSLCIYCMFIWSITWPTFLYTTIWNTQEGHFSLNKIHKNFDKFIYKNHKEILLTWYLVIVVTIILKFRDFFLY